MAAEIELILSDPQNPLLPMRSSIFYTLRPSPIAARYFKCLKEAERLPIWEPDRFYNFPGDYRNESWIQARLQEAIDTINSHSPGRIRIQAKDAGNQDALNSLHHDFELLRGSVLQPSDFYASAPQKVQQAVLDLNLNIHRLEDYRFNQDKIRRGRGPAAKIVLSYGPELPRYPLEEQDYREFTTAYTFGTWYVNYRELGKQLWDVFKDKDEAIGDANIRPMRYYSAEALLEFSRSNTEEEVRWELKKFWEWWDERADELRALGFKKNDPRNALSVLPVADLKRNGGDIAGMSDTEVLEHIGKFPYLCAVRTHG